MGGGGEPFDIGSATWERDVGSVRTTKTQIKLSERLHSMIYTLAVLDILCIGS